MHGRKEGHKGTEDKKIRKSIRDRIMHYTIAGNEGDAKNEVAQNEAEKVT